MRALIPILLGLMLLVTFARADPVNKVTFQGDFYATLDDTGSDSSVVGTQEVLLSVPVGWVLAPADDTSRQVAAAHTWGTECLVLADGSPTPTLTDAQCGQLFVIQADSFRSLFRRVLIKQNVPSIQSIVPSSISFIGGGQITISGLHLDHVDVTEVKIAGQSGVILSQSSSQIVVLSPSVAMTTISGRIELLSNTIGVIATEATVTYAVHGLVQTVTPSVGLLRGGTQVTVSGVNLGDGNDISQVLFGDVSCSIISQSSSSVVVTAPPSSLPGVVNVSIVSSAAGTTVSRDAFTYILAARIDSVSPVSVRLGSGLLFTLSGILGNGSDVSHVAIGGINCEIVSETPTMIVVRLPIEPMAGLAAVTLTSDSRGIAMIPDAITFLAPAHIDSVAPAAVRPTSGLVFTVSGLLGDGSDISSVTIGGINCDLISQTTDSVVARLRSTPDVGDAVVAITSASRGTATATAVTFLPLGVITLVRPAAGSRAGGFAVTIQGTGLVAGTELVTVSLANLAASVLVQSATTLVLYVPVLDEPVSAVLGDIRIDSAILGVTTQTSAFALVQSGTVDSIDPISGPSVGGFTVTVTGTNIGSGNDIYEAHIDGEPVPIQSQTASKLVLTVPSYSNMSFGAMIDLDFTSNSRGFLFIADAIIINPLGLVSSIVPAAIGLYVSVPVTVSGYGLGNGSDIASVTFGSLAAQILAQAIDKVVVVPSTEISVGLHLAVVTSLSRGIADCSVQLSIIRGVISRVAPTFGSELGGNTVNISSTMGIGSGVDITSVEFGSEVSLILSQATNWVSVLTPLGPFDLLSSSPMTTVAVDIRVNSTSIGSTVALQAFEYIAEPSILSFDPSVGVYVGGDTVTVTLRAMLEGATAINVNGLDAVIISQNADAITFVTPPSNRAGLANVTVFLSSGKMLSNGDGFTILQRVTVDAIRPMYGPQSVNTTVTISGSGFGTTQPVTVSFSETLLVTISQTDTTVVAVVPAGFSGGGDITLRSSLFGHVSVFDGFTRVIGGRLLEIIPQEGSPVGGDRVTLVGFNLGNGVDVTSVTFGSSSAVVVSQTDSVIVVETLASSAGSVDVAVVSGSVGRTVAKHGYSFVSESISAVTNFITVGDFAYAVLDNTAPNAEGPAGCQTQNLPVPPLWYLAADTNVTRAALLGTRFTFGTDCVVLVNGIAINTVTGADCGTAALVDAGQDYGVVSCNKRVLISSPLLSARASTWNPAPPITRFQVYNDKVYATMDNADPYDGSVGCQDVGFVMPSGWSLASPSVSVQADLKSLYFATECLLLAAGQRFTSGGQPCTATIVQAGNTYAVSGCNARILIESDVSKIPAPPAQPRSLRANILLISLDGGFGADFAEYNVFVDSVAAFNVPYTNYAVSPNPNSTALTGDLMEILYEYGSSTAGLFNAVVVTQLSVFAAPGCAPNMRAILAEYCRLFQVRLVYLNSFGSTLYGTTSETTQWGTFVFRFAPPAATDSWTLQSGLNTAANISSWAEIHPVEANGVVPVAPVFEVWTAKGVRIALAGADVDLLDGRRELHLYFAQQQYAFQSLMFMHYWVTWVTKGVYVGTRRVMLSTQVDDLYLSTDLYQTGGVGQNGKDAYRITADEFIAHNNFVYGRLRSLMAPGSTYTTEFALNGLGATLQGGTLAQDQLYQATLTYFLNFFWETHTWSHGDMDEGADGQPTTYAAVNMDLQLNAEFIRDHLLAVVDDAESVWSDNAMVTPAITGLFNPNALQAILDNNITYVVGDNSRPEIAPNNPYRCLWTTQAKNGLAGILIVPRSPTNIFYDVSTPAQDQNLYNILYQTTGVNFNKILNDEATLTSTNLFALRQDAYMFHQANLHRFNISDPITGKSTQHSLLSVWLTALMRDYNQYMTLPIVTYKHQKQAYRCLDRMARDTCDAQVRFVLMDDYDVEAVSVVTQSDCIVDVSGLRVSTNVDTDVEVEVYGREVTSFVPGSSVVRVFTTADHMLWSN